MKEIRHKGRKCQPITRRQTLDSSKLKEFAEENFKFDENSRKLSQRVEKHCGKRRNCSLRAISPFSSVFKRLVSQGRQKAPLCGNGLNLHLKFTRVFQGQYGVSCLKITIHLKC